MKIGYTSAIVTAILVMSAAWVGMSSADADGASDVTFDLNGGTLGGAGSFVMTADDLAGGLPGMAGALPPSGSDEFVVWSKSPSSYTDLYNPGDPVPDASTLYAIWGKRLNASANMSITAAGCYIVDGSTGKSLTISGSGDVLVVLRNVNSTSMQNNNNANVTFIVQGENGNNTFNGWSTPRLEFSSASTGHILLNEIGIGGAVVIRGDVTVNGKIQGSDVYIDGNVVGGYIETNGAVVIRGDVTINGRIRGGGSIDIDGDVIVRGDVESGGPVTIRGDLTADGKIQGSSVDIDGNVIVKGVDGIYSGGTVVIRGDVTVDNKIQGGSVDLEGTISSGSIYTGGELSIDGNVSVTGNTQGGSIDVKGTLISGTMWTTNLTVNDSAVVRVGGIDHDQPGKAYMGFVAGLSGVTDIVVQFKIDDNGTINDMAIMLPDFSNKIFLGTGVGIVISQPVDIYFTMDGKRYHSVGNVVHTSGTPGYYTCTLGPHTEVTDPDDEPDLSFTSAPPSAVTASHIYITDGMSVTLIVAGTDLTVTGPVGGVITITIPEESDIYGYWGTLDSMSPDEGTSDEYTIIDGGFDSSGTFVLFVTVGSQTVPVCLVVIPEIAFA